MSTESKPSIDDSLRTANQLFFALFRPLGTCLVMMTLVRFLFYWDCHRHFLGAETGDIVWAFLTGIRFDLLILGYFMIPVTLLLLACGWLRTWPRKVTWVVRGWLAIAWTAFVGLSSVDLVFFATHARHISIVDGFAAWQVLGENWPAWGKQTAFLTGGILLCAWIIGARAVLSEPFPAFSANGLTERAWRRVLRTLGPVFLVALAARGTVTAHHLEKQHSEISSVASVNQLAVNSLWAFDKTPE